MSFNPEADAPSLRDPSLFEYATQTNADLTNDPELIATTSGISYSWGMDRKEAEEKFFELAESRGLTDEEAKDLMRRMISGKQRNLLEEI